MKTDLDDALRTTFDQILSAAPPAGPVPVSASLLGRQGPNSSGPREAIKLALAAGIMVVIGVAASVAVRGPSNSQTVAAGDTDAPVSPTTSVVHVGGVTPGPGIGEETFRLATTASASAASRFETAAEHAGLTLELHEHATLTIVGDFELQWAYLSATEVRLFVFEGPVAAMDSLPPGAPEDEYFFEAAQGSSSLASHQVGNNGMALFLRSEALGDSGQALTRAQLVELADLIGSS